MKAKHMEPPEKIALQCELLRVQLKENGLERTVQLMDVAQRGEARKLIRDALATHARLLTGELVERTS
jgi:hypothetical protein